MFLAMVVALRRWYPGPVAPVLIGPLAAPIGAAIMIRTAILGKLRRGATWRGTVYGEAELREDLSASWTGLTDEERKQLETLAADTPCRGYQWLENDSNITAC